MSFRVSLPCQFYIPITAKHNRSCYHQNNGFVSPSCRVGGTDGEGKEDSWGIGGVERKEEEKEDNNVIDEEGKKEEKEEGVKGGGSRNEGGNKYRGRFCSRRGCCLCAHISWPVLLWPPRTTMYNAYIKFRRGYYPCINLEADITHLQLLQKISEERFCEEQHIGRGNTPVVLWSQNPPWPGQFQIKSPRINGLNLDVEFHASTICFLESRIMISVCAERGYRTFPTNRKIVNKIFNSIYTSFLFFLSNLLHFHIDTSGYLYLYIVKRNIHTVLFC